MYEPCTGTSWLSELNPAASENHHPLYDLGAYSTGLQHAFNQNGCPGRCPVESLFFFSICCLISCSYDQALCTFLIPTFQIMAENVQYLSELSLEGLRKQ